MHHSKATWHERFYLYRQHDETGISGTGVIAEGVRFSSGKCVIQWCVPGMPQSVSVFDGILDIAMIHGHNGSTLVMWMDETTDENPTPELAEAAVS